MRSKHHEHCCDKDTAKNSIYSAQGANKSTSFFVGTFQNPRSHMMAVNFSCLYPGQVILSFISRGIFVLLFLLPLAGDKGSFVDMLVHPYNGTAGCDLSAARQNGSRTALHGLGKF